MQGGGIVEHQFHSKAEQVGEAAIEGLRNRLLVGFEHIHRAVEMMQGQAIGPVNAHIFTQPLLRTLELGTGRTGPVGHHGKERTFDSKVDFMVGELLGDNLVDTQSMPMASRTKSAPKGQASIKRPCAAGSTISSGAQRLRRLRASWRRRSALWGASARPQF
jgi:hypothetical protein